MTSDLRAVLFLGTYGAAEAIKAHEEKKWAECYRKVNEQKK